MLEPVCDLHNGQVLVRIIYDIVRFRCQNERLKSNENHTASLL